jgi:hypothetical protein
MDCYNLRLPTPALTQKAGKANGVDQDLITRKFRLMPIVTLGPEPPLTDGSH